ncbi:MAG: GDSL-type esterase/lipase family protein [Oscillospiraceae bacterium]|nr:GDSL-type esterase/lipase family protein [Oscillospiraceae bacterium]
MAEVRTNRNRSKKKKRRSLFKLSIILLFFIFSIVISFIIYALRFDGTSKLNPGMQPADSQSDTSDSLSDSLSDNNSLNPDGSSDVSSDASSETPNSEASGMASTPGSVNPVAESQRQNDSYLDSCAFIGDSISTGFSGYKFVSKSNVFASIGLRIDNITEEKVETADGSEILVLDGLKKLKPENVYILLGSNGVSWYDNDKMIEDYSAFIDSIQNELPDSKVYILSITPVGTQKESLEKPKGVLNTEIDAFNKRLLELADKKSVYYVDLNSFLKDSSGKLPDSKSSDGMHFTKDTYATIIEFILKHTV